jgi:micrococcal nuclease
MKAAICFLTLALVFFAANIADAKDYVVKKIIDGGTIQLESGEVVKYAGICAPALSLKDGSSEFYAKEAARYNKKLVLLKKVKIEFEAGKKDSHGRLLAYVFVKHIFVNGELVRLGYARAEIEPSITRYKDVLLSYEQKAMVEERGLWQEQKKDSESRYIGNKKSYTLHRPSCPLVANIPEKGRIVFRKRADAIKIGYDPCKRCKP